MTSCSFCGHPTNGEDRCVLVIGPQVSICDVCIELSSEIVAEERRKAASPTRPAAQPEPTTGASDVR
jgi:ribosome-binding protein aMBF1 (putative translation factor)